MREPESMRLPGPLLMRILIWCALFVVFPLSSTTACYSFRVEVLCVTTSERFPPERPIVEQALTGRVLARLEDSEKREIDPWLRDDLRHSWISLSTFWRGSFPTFWDAFVDASYRIYGVHPDAVWPKIMAKRKAKLGPLYSAFYDENDLRRTDDLSAGLPPKKPVRSERSGEMGATKVA